MTKTLIRSKAKSICGNAKQLFLNDLMTSKELDAITAICKKIENKLKPKKS